MARALTAGELASLRKDGQKCRLYLAVLAPDTVLQRRLNSAPGTNDMVIALTYDDPDGGAGAFGDVAVGMTLYVSASAYGSYDKGMLRIRTAATATKLFVNESSGIDFDDDDYLTVVREYGLWPRHNYIDSAGAVYMDYDVEFTDPALNPHAYPAPVPILGPHACAWLSGGTVAVRLDASESYSVGGGSIGSYAWSVLPSGTASFDDATSGTPVLTLTAADTYTICCEVTWDYGGGNTVAAKGYRHVFVYDDNNQPTTVFQLGQCSGDLDTGGWAFQVTMQDEAQRSEIRDRALVVLFARDWYGDTEENIGPIKPGSHVLRANVIAVGWVGGESIVWNPEQGTVNFEVQGPQHWLNLMQGFPSGIEDYDGTPTSWVEMEDLTVRKGLWHFLHWRTTATMTMDCFIFPDTQLDGSALSTEERQIAVFDAPPMALWPQLAQAAETTIRARIACDRYGRLFAQRDANEIPETDRASIPTVQTLATQDWQGEIGFERRALNQASMLDTSGVGYKDGDGYALFSLAPGHIFDRYGGIQRADRLALWATADKQTLINELCAMIYATMNNEYPTLPVTLASNHRCFDICPWQYASLAIASSDTERGIAWAKNLLPRRVAFTHDAGAGTLIAAVDFEPEVIPGEAQDGDPPPQPPDPPDPPVPPPPPPPPTPPEPAIPEIAFVLGRYSGASVIGASDTFDEDTVVWADATDGGMADIMRISLDQGGELLYAFEYGSGNYGKVWKSNAKPSSMSWSVVLDDAAIATALDALGYTFDHTDASNDLISGVVYGSTIYVDVSCRCNVGAGYKRMEFLLTSTDSGGSWTAYRYSYPGTDPWHNKSSGRGRAYLFDVHSGFRVGGQHGTVGNNFHGINKDGGTVYETTPEHAGHAYFFTGLVQAGATWYSLNYTGKLYSTSDGGAVEMWVYQSVDDVDYRAGLSQGAGALFYVQIVSGSGSKLFVGGSETLESSDLYSGGSEDQRRIGRVTPLSTNSAKFGVVRLNVSTPISGAHIHWVHPVASVQTVKNRTGNWETIFGAWEAPDGASAQYGNCMLVYLE